MLEQTGLAERARDRYRGYSLGMKQRLAIAATLLKSPDLLIFDEPTNGLDPAGIREIRETMRRLGEAGATVLVSSHILAEVEQVADTVSIIGHGRLLAEGPVEQVIGARGDLSVRVGVADPEAAEQVLTARGLLVERDGPGLRVRGTPDPARITYLLARQGLYVHELVPLRRDLESVFLELTAGRGAGRAPAGRPGGRAGPGRPRGHRGGGGMTRLTRVELRRLFSRRLVVLALLAGVVVTGFFLVTAWTAAQPMTPAEQAQAQQWYDDARADWERNGEQMVAECRQAEADERAQGQDVDFGCDQIGPQREHFFGTVQPLAESLPTTLTLHAFVLLLLAFLVGATATAAELSTGAMSSWLTFEPRRLRVYGSKVLAPGLGIAPAAVVLLLLLVGGAWLIASGADTAGSMTAAAWRSTAWTMLRILALTVLAAVAGAALGFLLRHTAAVLGVAIGYLVVVEGVAGSMLAPLAALAAPAQRRRLDPRRHLLLRLRLHYRAAGNHVRARPARAVPRAQHRLPPRAAGRRRRARGGGVPAAGRGVGKAP